MSATYKYICCFSNLHNEAAYGSPAIVILLYEKVVILSVRDTPIYIMITGVLFTPLL